MNWNKRFEKIKKGAFEKVMFESYGGTIGATRTREMSNELDECDQPIYTPLTLYYFDNVHIGTFCKGKAWCNLRSPLAF